MTPRDEFEYSLMNLMWLKNSTPRDFLEKLYDKFVEDFAPKDMLQKHVDSVNASTNLLPKSNDLVTRRDYFAAAALGGMLSNPATNWNDVPKGFIYEKSVTYADKLIEELGKENGRTI